MLRKVSAYYCAVLTTELGVLEGTIRGWQEGYEAHVLLRRALVALLLLCPGPKPPFWAV
jgi:hypothetical protein